MFVHFSTFYIYILYTEISYKCINIDNLFTTSDVESKFRIDTHRTPVIPEIRNRIHEKRKRKIEITISYTIFLHTVLSIWTNNLFKFVENSCPSFTQVSI